MQVISGIHHGSEAQSGKVLPKDTALQAEFYAQAGGRQLHLWPAAGDLDRRIQQTEVAFRPYGK